MSTGNDVLLNLINQGKKMMELDPSTMEQIREFLKYYNYPLLSILFMIICVSLALSAGSILKEAGKIKAGTWFWAVMAMNFGLVLRFFYVPHYPRIFFDEIAFMEIAENLYRYGLNMMNYGGFWRPEVLPGPVGWPYLVSLLLRVTGVNINAGFFLCALISTLCIPAVFWLVTLLFDNEKAGLWSSLAYGVSPIYLRLSGSLAKEMPSVVFTIFTLLFIVLYFRQRKTSLLYLSAACLAFTLNIRQEAPLTLLPLIFLFFLLFHPDMRKELKNIHFYICMVFVLIYGGLAAISTLYGVSVGMYVFFESQDMIRKYIITNIQYNITYWIANRIQPLSLTIMGVTSLWLLFRKNRRTALYFSGWFVFLQIFYSLNPSCDFSGIYTVDSWRNAVNQLIPVIILAGLTPAFIEEYFLENYPKARKFIPVLLVLVFLWIPIRFHSFINQKTQWGRDYLFMHSFTRRIPSDSVVILDGSHHRPIWYYYMNEFRYVSPVMGVYYENLAPEDSISSRKLFYDFYRWSQIEKRPVFLYMTRVGDLDSEMKQEWYRRMFRLRLLGGYGFRPTKTSHILYEVMSIRNLPFKIIPPGEENR